MLIDTHAHLYWESFKEDFGQVIQRAIDAGVTTIINVGVDVEKSKEALAQVEDLAKIPNISFYSSIGIHPEEALHYAQGKLDPNVSIRRNIGELEKLYQSDTSKVVAIGECGLDFLFANNPWGSSPTLPPEQIKGLQRQLFQAQIDLAKKLNLPLLVHCRDDRTQNPMSSEAWDQVVEMVGNYPTILHCFSGLPHTTDLVLSSSNLIVSFAGNITYPKNDYLREAARVIPLERITLETDCPFLVPQSKRGQRNEPANILEVVQVVANIKDISVDEVARQTTANAAKIFAF